MKKLEDNRSNDNNQIKVGTLVLSKSLNSKGTVIGISNKHALVLIGNLKTRLLLSDLKAVPIEKSINKAKNSKVRIIIEPDQRPINQTIDLHGMRVHEALALIEATIDKAILLGFNKLTIIHGLGEGRILKALESYLPTNPSVLNFLRDPTNPGITHLYL